MFGNNNNNNNGGGFSFGQNSGSTANPPPLSLGSNNAGSSSGFTFGHKPNNNNAIGTGGSGFSLGGPQNSNTGGSGFSFGSKPATNTTGSSGFSFGNKPAATNTSSGFSFGNKPVSTTTGSSGFSFGNNPTTTTTTPATSGFSFGNKPVSTTTGSSGFSFGNNPTTTTTTPATSGFSFGNSGTSSLPAKPSIFGNSQTTGQTTTSALLGGSSAAQVPGKVNTPYGSDLAKMAQNMAEMPQSLTPREEAAGLKRKRSVSSTGSATHKQNALPFMGNLGDSFKKNGQDGSVRALFRGQKAANGKKTAGHVDFKPNSQYRRLVIRHSRDAFKNYGEIDPNAVLLKNVSVNVTKAHEVSDFRPKKKRVKIADVELPDVEPSDGQEKLEPPPETSYWSSPPIEVLQKMTYADLVSVEDFTVGRRGCGQISYRLPVDLSEFQGRWDRLFDKTVKFGGMFVAVYEDGPDKPSPGNGLNVPATVTIEGCYPKDKATKKMVKDPGYAGLADYIRRLKRKEGMEFVNYEPISGSYTFNVEHFSIWGLVDEEEDDPEVVKRYAEQQKREQEITRKREEMRQRMAKRMEVTEEEMVGEEEAEEADDFVDASEDVSMDDLVHVHAYEPEIDDADVLAIKPENRLETSQDWNKQLSLASGFHSVFNKNFSKVKKLTVDAHNVNRVLFKDKPKNPPRPRKASILPSFPLAKKYQQCLDWEISRAKFESVAGFPLVKFDGSVSLNSTLIAFKDTPDYEFWHLLAILFDDEYCYAHLAASDTSFCEENTDLRPRVLDIKRRELLELWLRRVTPTAPPASGDPLDTVYSLVCADRLGEAVKTAIKAARSTHLGALLSEIDSNDASVRSLAANQLNDWSSSGTLRRIPQPVLKVYKLLAGQILSDRYVKHLQGLRWPTVLFLLMKYGADASSKPIADLIRQFVSYIEVTPAMQPAPTDADYTYYQLIRLLVEPQSVLAQFSVEKQFLLAKKLNLVLQVSSTQADTICKLFAAKLAQYRQFDEAIFVCEHIVDGSASAEIKAIVTEHVDGMGFLEDDVRLRKIHRSLALPLNFLHTARAARFSALDENEKAVRSYIDAESLQEAHSLLLEKVAPAYVIGDVDLGRFKELLGHFRLLPEWSVGAELYSDYVDLVQSTDAPTLKSLITSLLNGLPLLKETNFQVGVAKTIIYKRVIRTIFNYDLDYNAAELLELRLPASEMNYLKTKLGQQPGMIEG